MVAQPEYTEDGSKLERTHENECKGAVELLESGVGAVSSPAAPVFSVLTFLVKNITKVCMPHYRWHLCMRTAVKWPTQPDPYRSSSIAGCRVVSIG